MAYYLLTNANGVCLEVNSNCNALALGRMRVRLF